MITYPAIDPVIISFGPFSIRWYGLMYVIGFTAAYLLVARQAKVFNYKKLLNNLDNLNLNLILGVIVGGRIGYVCFYNLSYYLSNPLEIPAVWQGGMSFHGGCIGALVAGYLFCRNKGLNYWIAADFYVATVPIGLFFGRIGNFINGELYGRISDVPWAMIFPSGGPLPRHPSQLYEAFLEGVVLFTVLWSCKKYPWTASIMTRRYWPHGTILSLFLALYGLFRIFVESVREPDPQLGLLFAGLTMGQVLSILMSFLGVALWLQRVSSSKA